MSFFPQKSKAWLHGYDRVLSSWWNSTKFELKIDSTFFSQKKLHVYIVTAVSKVNEIIQQKMNWKFIELSFTEETLNHGYIVTAVSKVNARFLQKLNWKFIKLSSSQTKKLRIPWYHLPGYKISMYALHVFMGTLFIRIRCSISPTFIENKKDNPRLKFEKWILSIKV